MEIAVKPIVKKILSIFHRDALIDRIGDLGFCFIQKLNDSLARTTKNIFCAKLNEVVLL